MSANSGKDSKTLCGLRACHPVSLCKMSVLGNTFTKTAAFGGGKRLSMAPKSPKATTVLGDVTLTSYS